MRRFMIFTKAMFLIHLRSREVLFWNFAFPVFLMLIYGVIMRQFIAWMTPGVIVLNALSFGLVSSATMLVEMRDKGILRRLRATPLPANQLFLGAYLIVNLLLGLGQGAVILLSAALLYQVPFTAAGLLLGIPMIIAGALTFLALGQVVSGIAPRTGVATAMGMTIYFGLMFISDMVFPLTMLPEWLQNVVKYLPTYLVAQLVRSPLIDGIMDPQWLSYLAGLALYAIAGSLIAAKVFRWDPRS